MNYMTTWQASADAMDRTVEGNRLIATEIARAARQRFQAAVKWLATTFRDAPAPRNLPPV